MKTLLTIALLGGVLATTATRALPVHTALESTLPAEGDTLAVAPDRVELRFTGPVDPSVSGVELVDGTGNTTALTVERGPDGDRHLFARLPGLANGGYRVNWRTVAADGHPVQGSFVFYLSVPPPVAAPVAEGPVSLAPPPPPAAPEVSLPVVASLLRGVGVGSLAMLAGLLFFVGWFAQEPGARVSRLTTVLAWVAPTLLAGHALAWAAYATGSAGDASVSATLLSSLPGQVELVRLGLAALALWSVVLVRRARLGAVFALAAVAVGGFAGHSLAFTPEVLVPARMIHIIAFTVWAGGLLILLATTSRGGRFQSLTGTVSSAALGAVVVLAATGVLHILLFPATLGQLATSLYGALLAAKITGLAILIGFGASNRRNVIPHLPEEDAVRALRRNVAWEVAVMSVVLITTGVLAYVPVPQPAFVASAETVLQPETMLEP